MNKPVILQYSLMLSPLIGASDSLVKALGLGLAWLLVLSLYALSMHALRRLISADLHWLASLLLSATLSSCVLVAMQAWFFELHQQIGIYLGLIALQCVLLEHCGFFQHPAKWRLTGGYALLLITLGTLRELLGHGSLGSHLQWLAGSAAADWQGWLLTPFQGLHLLTLAPGGFILLGLLLAARQALAAPSTSHRPPSRN